MAELDFEPFSCEAFPGAEFFFTGTRDLLTLNSHEPASERTLPLLSLERRGYIVRHKLPGDYTIIPPADGNCLPLEGQAHQVPRPPQREAAAPRLRAPGIAPAARPEPPRTHDLSFSRAHVRLQQRNGHFGEGPTIVLEANTAHGWLRLAVLDPESGRLTRLYQEPHLIPELRARGFCVSRDGAIAVSNPTRNRRERAEPPADLDPIAPPPDAVPEGPLPDRILAAQERLREISAFFRDNAPLFDATRAMATRYRLPKGVSNGDDWPQYWERCARELDAIRQVAIDDANAPPNPWRHTHYRWKQRIAHWEFIEMLDGDDVPRTVPAHTMHLPPGVNGVGDGDPATCNVRDGWHRNVWFNPETGDFLGDGVRPEVGAQVPIPVPAEQGGANHPNLAGMLQDFAILEINEEDENDPEPDLEAELDNDPDEE